MVDIEFHIPNFSEQDAVRLAELHFGLKASARALPSERDRNFRLTTEKGREYVLKIAHAGEKHEILDMQNRTMEHLADRAPELSIPRVCASTRGETIVAVADSEGVTHLMRLLTYIPGKLWVHVTPHSPELLLSLGRTFGVIDQALQDFSHPASTRELKWDLARAGWIRDYFQHINQPARRDIVHRFLSHYESIILPQLSNLRSSVIYNDANDYNVLVSNDYPRAQEVIGVIDFGDMVQTYTVCELAIAAAYAMMGQRDPIAAAAHVAAGYNHNFRLTESELEILFPLICMRLCMTVTNAAYQRGVEPGNEYLLVSERSAWEVLDRLALIDPQYAHYAFRHACGLPACPSSLPLRQWLTTHTDQIGNIVEQDLSAATSVIFDLSVGSTEIGNNSDFNDIAAFTRNLFNRMKQAGVSVGIGRYNEARAIYGGEQFQTEKDNGPVSRSVHLGLDIFMESGSPVLAPLDGTVHSYRNNAAAYDYGPTIILQHTFPEIGKSPISFYTLYGHLSADSLEGLHEGMAIKRGDRIGRIGNPPGNGNWPPHVHFQIISDLLGLKDDFPGAAFAVERDVWLSICPDPNLIARIPEERLAVGVMSIDRILAARREHIGRNLSISYEKPLKIVRGYMQYLYDEDGRAYLDAVNNVPCVGHCHPHVVRAGQAQMALLNTNSRYLHENLVRYAERLCAKLPHPLRVCFFVCSGSEANELALRLARTHTRQKDTIVIDVAYHGNTAGLIEISPYKHAGPGGAGVPQHVHVVPMPDPYRGPYKGSDPGTGEKYARHVGGAIEKIQRNGRAIGAFIAESILGCGGQIVLPDGYLKASYQHVREAGGVCIADEVQVGFGRVGTHFWAFETQGVVPDIVTMGKPIGNGHPLAAVITTPEIAASFDNGMEYFNTFGGNPVSCAIGMAVLDVIEREHLQANALAVGNYLMSGLRRLMEKHPIIGDVRGLGLFIGAELVLNRHTMEPAAEQASYIVNRLKEHGILMSFEGPHHNVLKIKPPLVFSRANADLLLRMLDKILHEDFVRLEG